MAKKNTKGAAATMAAAFNAEEFQKLSPEEQAAYIEKLHSDNAALQEAAEAAKAAAKTSTKKGDAKSLPTFEVEEEKDIEGGEYQFTCPTFTWDDGKVIDVHKLMAMAESKEEKVSGPAGAIMGELVRRKSGIVKRKED